MRPLTVKEAAAQMRVSAATVYALCAARKLRHQRVGVGRGKILIPPDAVTEYLAKGTVPSAEGAVPPPARKVLKTFEHLDSDRLLAAWKEQGAVRS
ncbi:helix-turn-helix domain-containing protein [Frigoriglobus tundricola]|uniref:helix-turn-helix domain-containing protein n=1 Tax=Frigoriglobus tundricola TaxID=2774151 RepID=UPI00148EBC4B|nr:helix-turn-helix domain-containing protein [Frigoriglobus tundricola]